MTRDSLSGKTNVYAKRPLGRMEISENSLFTRSWEFPDGKHFAVGHIKKIPDFLEE